MRQLIFILILTCFSFQFSSASINEYKSDIYFANGVGATSYKVSFDQGYGQYESYIEVNTQMKPYIAKYNLAFNTGKSVIADYFEAFLQYSDENPEAKVTWMVFKKAIGYYGGKIGGGAVKLSEAVTRSLEHSDITAQVQEYRKSIYSGHRVIVLAHSQGNFFTNKAYKTFDTGADKWMQQFFTTVGLATPSSVEIPNSIYLTFDNDPITVLNGAGGKIPNPTRYYHWLPHPETQVDDASTIPCAGVFLPRGQTPYCSDDGWYAEETTHEEFHDFNYTMSIEPIKGQTYSFLTNGIIEHLNTPSQWKFTKENECALGGCDDVLGKVEHLYNSELNYLLSEFDIYPFNKKGKIYDINGYGHVMASHGGVDIKDKSYLLPYTDICYELIDKDNQVLETIATCSACPDPSLYEITSHNDVGTKDWRISVKNTETNETIEGVYPFNVDGSVYQLDTGEWVMASCGGYEIESNWDGQEEDECYRLKGTGEIIKEYTWVIWWDLSKRYRPTEVLMSKWIDDDDGLPTETQIATLSEMIETNGTYGSDLMQMQERIAHFQNQGLSTKIETDTVYSRTHIGDGGTYGEVPLQIDYLMRYSSYYGKWIRDSWFVHPEGVQIMQEHLNTQRKAWADRFENQTEFVYWTRANCLGFSKFIRVGDNLDLVTFFFDNTGTTYNGLNLEKIKALGYSQTFSNMEAIDYQNGVAVYKTVGAVRHNELTIVTLEWGGYYNNHKYLYPFEDFTLE